MQDPEPTLPPPPDDVCTELPGLPKLPKGYQWLGDPETGYASIYRKGQELRGSQVRPGDQEAIRKVLIAHGLLVLVAEVPALAPCPFCGGEAHYRPDADNAAQ